MKRPSRNAKEPTRFADIIQFTSSSDNEPPVKQKRLLKSTSIQDDIKKLKLTLANRSLPEFKKYKHKTNCSFSQPLHETLHNERSHTNRSQTSLSQPDRTSDEQSFVNRSPTPLLQLNHTSDRHSRTNRSHTPSDKRSRIDRSWTPSNKKSRTNRSLTPRLDSIADRKSYSNSQLKDRPKLALLPHPLSHFQTCKNV